jgi:hypothetical protein
MLGEVFSSLAYHIQDFLTRFSTSLEVLCIFELRTYVDIECNVTIVYNVARFGDLVLEI